MKRSAITLVLRCLVLGLLALGVGCGDDGDETETPARIGLSIVDPVPGAQLGPADDTDPATLGIQYSVRCESRGIPSASVLFLSVSGGGAPLQASTAEDGTAVFTDVTLPPGDEVTLEVTGPLGLRARSVVGVEAPPASLAFLVPQDGQRLEPADDADAGRAGLQFDVRLSAQGLPVGTEVRLVVGDDGVRRLGQVDGAQEVAFPGITLPESESLTLEASATYAGQDLSAEIQISVTAPLPPAPTVEWVSPAADQVLGTADDADGDLFNGLQTDLVLAVENVENNQPAALWIDGVLSASQANVVNGTLRFVSVTLPEAPEDLGGLELEVRVSNLAQVEASASRRVFVDTGRCVVTLAPLPNPAGCDITADPLPATPEIEADFEIRSNCERAELLLNGVGLGMLDVGPEGTLLITAVPLQEGSNELQARAEGSGERVGESLPSTFEVDTIAPSTDFYDLPEPDAGPLYFALVDDLDPEQDGLQVGFSGWVTGKAPGEELAVRLTGPDGEPVAAVPTLLVLEAIDDEGRNRFELMGLTLASSGSYLLQVAASDACGNEGLSTELHLLADVERPELSIESPEPMAVLLAADDQDPLAEGYQTSILVRLRGVPEGERIEVLCGERDSNVRRTVGAVLAPEPPALAPLAVPVTLSQGWIGCYAAYRGINEARSEEVVFLVAGEGPTLVFLEPRGPVVAAASVRVALATTGVEDDQPVDLWVNDVAQELDLRVLAGGVAVEGVALTAGPNTLRARVSNRLGHEAEAVLEILRDDEAPRPEFLSPADGQQLNADEDADGDPSNGFQYDLRIAVAGLAQGEVGQACLSLDGVLLAPCPEASLPVSGAELLVPALRLLPGSHELRVELRDAAGNLGVATAHYDLVLDAPTCALRAVGGTDCLASGAEVEVTLDTDAADGSAAYLNIAGQLAAQVAVQGGVAVFVVDLPEDGATLLEASVEDPVRGVGFSLPRRVQVRGSAGRLAFVSPAPGTLVNAAVPSTTYPGFALDVRVESEGVELGQEVQLQVRCDAGASADLSGTVEALDGDRGLVIWRGVALDELATCALSARSTNCAGLEALAEMDLVVDRIPPQIEFLFPRDGDTLSFRNDLDPAADGLQTYVRLVVRGVEPGTEVLLHLLGAEPLRATVGENLEANFPRVLIPDGVAVPLSAEVLDPAGNRATASVLLQEVISGQPTIAFFAPAADTTWLARDDLAPEVPGFQQEFRFNTAHLRDGLQLSLCSDLHAGVGALCSRQGFRVVASAPIQANAARMRRVTLQQGRHNVYAEARYVAEDVAVSTPIALNIDATPPKGSLAATSDQPPLGVLNRSEDLDPATPGLQATFVLSLINSPDDPFDGMIDGILVALRSNNPVADTLLLRAPVQQNAVRFTNVTLAQGLHNLSVTGYDAAGNPLSLEQPLQILVDTEVPQITFTRPVAGEVLNSLSDADLQHAGLQYAPQVSIAGAGPGRPVALTLDGVPLAEAVSREGLVTFAAQSLPEGTLVLGASVSDAAGNQAEASAQVQVDTLPPVLTILEPAADRAYAANEDIEPARGGFQVDVRVQVEGVALGQEVEISSDRAGGLVGPATPVDELGFATVRCTLPAGPQVLVAASYDAQGNLGVSVGVPITVEVVGCGLAFVRPVGNPVLLGQAQDANGDPADGCQTEVTLSVANLDCEGLQVDLLRGGELWSQAQVQDGAAVFAGLDFPDGSDYVLQGRATYEGEESFSEDKRVRTDLSPPSVTFTDPAGPLATLLAARDTDPEVAGLQISLGLRFEGAAGGQLVIEGSSDGPLLTLPNAQFPQALADGDRRLPATVSLGQGEQTLTATLRDAAGNSSTATLQVVVDAVPPAAPVLSLRTQDEAGLLNLRLPRVEFSWTAPGDDDAAGAAVDHYDLRYSANPIDEANFGAACPLDGPAEIAAPGELQTLLVEGPGTPGACRLRLEGTYHFALRAFDRLGNPSELSLLAAPLVIALQRVAVQDPAGTAAAFGRFVTELGDVDGDGFADLGVSAQDDARAWIVYGAELLDAPEVQELTPAADVPAFYGRRMAALGDVDGDGRDDFAVTTGAEVWLYFGAADLRDAPASPALRLASTGSFPNVAGAGNFDGQGPVDLIVGDLDSSGRSGAAWIVPGRTRAEWLALGGHLTLSLDPASFDADGDGDLDMMAFANSGAVWVSVRGIGRFCGGDDSFDDVAVGAFGANANAGQVFVVCGRALEARLGDLGVDGWRLSPPAGVAGFGLGLAGGASLLDDTLRGLPSDLYDELVISAPPSKRFFVYPGGATDAAQLQSWAAAVEMVTESYNYFAEFPAVLGDLDGNGLVDVAGSSKLGDTGLAGVYLNLGDAAADGEPFGDPDPVYRGVQGSKFGEALAGPGDMNADGFPDLAIGAPGQATVYLLY